MENLFFSKILLLLYIIFLRVKPIDIILTPILEKTTTDNYKIAKNILLIQSNGEYKISGSCSECQIPIKIFSFIKLPNYFSYINEKRIIKVYQFQ